MNVILSIKPEYANKIFDGTKKYEFRRAIFKNPDVRKVVVYSSSPVQKIIGEFEIDCIISHELNELWNKTKKHSGISEDFFFQYFGEKELGFAIKIKNTKLYKVPKCIREDYKLFPPQSFLYYANDKVKKNR
jgi:predicted transcriptional regulator